MNKNEEKMKDCNCFNYSVTLWDFLKLYWFRRYVQRDEETTNSKNIDTDIIRIYLDEHKWVEFGVCTEYSHFETMLSFIKNNVLDMYVSDIKCDEDLEMVCVYLTNEDKYYY